METMFRFGQRLAAATMVLCLVAACKKEKTNEPSAPGTIEWQTVPTEGGAVEKDDITIRIPGETFTTETQVGVTEVMAGETLGEDECPPSIRSRCPLP